MNGRFTFRSALEKLKVLVVDSLPRWEYRYLRNALARDPGVELSCLLLRPDLGPGEGGNYIPAFPDSKEALAPYDVVFLGDVGIGQDELTDHDAELLKGLVEQQGSGLVFVPGRRGRETDFSQQPAQGFVSRRTGRGQTGRHRIAKRIATHPDQRRQTALADALRFGRRPE